MKLRLARPPCSSTSAGSATSPTSRTAAHRAHRRADPPPRRGHLRTWRGSRCRCWPHVAGQIGDPQVRHRGTIGGSIAHGDPASDLPAALLALRGTLVVRGPGGEREVAADDFFTGFLETALAPDEVLTEIRVPGRARRRLGVPEVQPPRPGLGHRRRRRGADQRLGGPGRRPGQHGLDAAAGRRRRGGAAVRARPRPTPPPRADEGTEPPDDLNASPEYRRHLAQVLVRRALESRHGAGGP